LKTHVVRILGTLSENSRELFGQKDGSSGLMFLRAYDRCLRAVTTLLLLPGCIQVEGTPDAREGSGFEQAEQEPEQHEL
jgi:hypothetical protein